MKPKKNAFTNTSTGYGKHHHRQNLNRNEKAEKNENNSKTNPKLTKEEKQAQAVEEEKDLNSGFGDYLRSPESVEMMKLFVFANTIMLIVTMAWPNIREQYYWFMHWWNSYQSEY